MTLIATELITLICTELITLRCTEMITLIWTEMVKFIRYWNYHLVWNISFYIFSTGKYIRRCETILLANTSPNEITHSNRAQYNTQRQKKFRKSSIFQQCMWSFEHTNKTSEYFHFSSSSKLSGTRLNYEMKVVGTRQ